MLKSFQKPFATFKMPAINAPLLPGYHAKALQAAHDGPRSFKAQNAEMIGGCDYISCSVRGSLVLVLTHGTLEYPSHEETLRCGSMECWLACLDRFDCSLPSLPPPLWQTLALLEVGIMTGRNGCQPGETHLTKNLRMQNSWAQMEGNRMN